MIGFVSCKHKFVILPPNTSAVSLTHFNCCATWCRKTWQGVTAANCFFGNCQCFSARWACACVRVRTHRCLPLSWKVLGWGLALKSQGSLNQKQSCIAQHLDFSIIQTNERRRRAWIMESTDNPQWVSSVCTYLAPGILMLIVMLGLDWAISRIQNQDANVSRLCFLTGPYIYLNISGKQLTCYS